MLILLSPAKSLDFDSEPSAALSALDRTLPLLQDQSNVLARSLGGLSKTELKSLLGVSDSLAALNHARYADFDQQPSRAAIAAFQGQAYKGLDAMTLEPAAISYLQSNLRILCGLYGSLRPLDEIRPYRLDMGCRWSPVKGAPSLYKFWDTSITEALNVELEARTDTKFVLNVASQEYAKSVDLKALRAPVITAAFPGPAVHAKMARGEMVRFCAERAVSDPDELKEFSGKKGEWRFVPAESTAVLYVFHRGSPGKVKNLESSSAGSTKAATRVASTGSGKGIQTSEAAAFSTKRSAKRAAQPTVDAGEGEATFFPERRRSRR